VAAAAAAAASERRIASIIREMQSIILQVERIRERQVRNALLPPPPSLSGQDPSALPDPPDSARNGRVSLACGRHTRRNTVT
jgi:hypothetical protein